MDRREIILQHLDLDKAGLEIGPSHNPVAPKKMGYSVEIIDHLDREGLIKKYEGHGVQLDNIEEVDFVWHGERYADLTGKSHYYNWIIASHVIEHTPDLIAFINECDEILAEDGLLSLAIPDKRYCFDHFRPLSSIASVVNSHARGDRNHPPGSIAEYFCNVVKLGNHIAWDETMQGDYSMVHTLEDAIRGMRDVSEAGVYIDIHRWCFVPHSFRLLIHDLSALGLIHLGEVDFHPTQGCEFYMTLGRAKRTMTSSRIDWLRQIDAESATGAGLAPAKHH
jgi:predicted SAM-dependent methyltransferase